ncbi:MarR family winged helix-turn-helix transcriptional regulator [Lacrimispora sphenoides]|uniref:DNA-binding transcriptional regulator, MarR family n=1 Tax=Lacrimispora sphenoides JCM 1415 TaxID=1297793 RepID=A0ABY1C498_9FIRM|nr:transcriptional regulator [Lacrimispora sphenoides]SET63950.1 DNA-binding transcriptional regulator, MarR family [[Clostridium] sphenoides JCM 1415]SUY50203.1 MarR family transcriptional regulator [Lacrimispora sphenoides]
MSSIEELVDSLGDLMSRGKVMDEFNRSGKGEIFILRYLYTKESPASPSELSEALNSSTARISAALRTLEKKGQIHREIDTTNRRFILVTITEEGRERIQANMQRMQNHLIQVLTVMGEKDAREFVRLSTRFFEIAQSTMPDPFE